MYICKNNTFILMRKYFISAILTIISICTFSQTKILNLEDCIYRNSELFPKYYRSLQWIPNTNNYSYISNDSLIVCNTKTEKNKFVLTLSELKKYIINSTLNDSVKFNYMPSVQWQDKNNFTVSDGKGKYLVDTKKKQLSLITNIPESDNLLANNNGTEYAFTKGNDLYITKDGEEICIAKSEGEGILYGSDRVHRSEFGIDKGIFWSPKDNFVAFYRMDESMVTDYPLVDITTRIAEAKNIKYPMAGMTSHQVTLGVYNINTQKTTYIKTGEPVDQYLTSISWGPSEEYIYIGILNRDQNHLKVNKYDVTTGNLVKTLFEEKNEKYVEPEHPIFFICENDKHFLWMSERDGWNHLYLYDTDGNLIKQVTKGKWEVLSVVGFNNDESELFIISTETSPLNKDLYAVDMNNGNTRKISAVDGSHSVILSPEKKHFIDTYSNTEKTKVCDIIDLNGNVVKNLIADYDPLQDYAQCNITIGTIKSENGADLYYRMITPPDFDPNKKYPVFFYVYGGPHLQMVTNSWNGGAGFWDLRWAQRGYIVFSMDNHGTPHRGLEFEQAIHRNLGVLEVADQMKGVEYLKSLPYVDSDKMSVDGWSYGGFMTISLLLKHPEVFKVGVAGGPVIDWKYYEIMYGERYMDTPEDNPVGYRNASLLNYVDNLESKLLIIHCTTDPVVVWQHSLTFVDKCIKAGKQLDYFVYPGHDHNVMGIDRVHLYQKIENYIDDALF